jgi:Ca2+/H+ antiporter
MRLTESESGARCGAGCCFFFGGMRYQVQTFNMIANQVCNSLLFLAVVALTLPCAAAYLPDTKFSEADMLLFSRIIAILLLGVYVAYLYFQLISHNSMFVSASNEPTIGFDGEPVTNGGGGGASGGEGGEAEPEDEAPEQPALTVTAELLTLLCISVVVAAASECAPHLAPSSGLPPLACLLRRGCYAALHLARHPRCVCHGVDEAERWFIRHG